MKRAVLVLIAVCALVAVGCSSKKSSNKSGDTTTTTKAETQSLSSDERDQIASDSLLTTADLPGSGWKTESAGDANSLSDDVLTSAPDLCVGMPADRDRPPTLQLVSFGVGTNGFEKGVADTVGVWETSEDASAVWALVIDNEDSLGDCLQATWYAGLRAGGLGAGVIAVDVGAVDLNLGDESVGFKLSIEVLGMQFGGVVAMVRTGPAVATFTTFALDKSDSDEVIATAADKLEQAVAG